MKNKEIGAFRVETTKIGLKALKVGTFTFSPQAIYVDDVGQTKTYFLNAVKITVSQATSQTLPDRVSTGTTGLDKLLVGGIPETYSIILMASPSDERELLVRRFLEASAQMGQTTVYLTTEARKPDDLIKTFSANFSLFLCSSQAELTIDNLPNVHKIKGVDNLTEIDIVLAKYLRTLDSSSNGHRTACIQIVSDVLLQHHGVITRKWLNSLLATLKSKGFTILALIDPRMHPVEEMGAVASLFDGEINIGEREGARSMEKILKILRLYNREYSRNEMVLTREKLTHSNE